MNVESKKELNEGIVVNVDELWLKGKNRSVYFKALIKHVRETFWHYHGPDFSCNKEGNRILVTTKGAFNDSVYGALKRVAGVHSFFYAKVVGVDETLIYPAVKELLSVKESLPNTFKVKTVRSFKRFPKDSQEISREVGGKVLKDFDNLKAKMVNPELLIQINITEENIFISVDKHFGMGGQPYGTTGHLVTLLSGGFDSPVASYLMAKRGCHQTFVFFYAYPFVGNEVKEKILNIASALGKFQRETRLYIVPFGDVQKKISQTCRSEYRTLLFRKYMIECSALLAKKINGGALCTGDSLAQVSSQTMGNISVIDSTCDMSIFRPLLGFNKSETLSIAKNINIYKLSEVPHDDACSLFAPKFPIIRPDTKYWSDFDRENDFSSDLEECLNKAEIYKISILGEIESATD